MEWQLADSGKRKKCHDIGHRGNSCSYMDQIILEI